MCSTCASSTSCRVTAWKEIHVQQSRPGLFERQGNAMFQINYYQYPAESKVCFVSTSLLDIDLHVHVCTQWIALSSLRTTGVSVSRFCSQVSEIQPYMLTCQTGKCSPFWEVQQVNLHNHNGFLCTLCDFHMFTSMLTLLPS